MFSIASICDTFPPSLDGAPELPSNFLHAVSSCFIQLYVTIRSFTESPLNSLYLSGWMCQASPFAKSSRVSSVSLFKLLFNANSILLDSVDCSSCTEEVSSFQEQKGVERRSVSRVKRKIARLTRFWLLRCLDPCI